MAQDVFRVEEDWELVIGQPDTMENGPQVTCAISPLDVDASYCAFDINYRTLPAYSAGGLQLHTWTPDEPMYHANSAKTGLLATREERITWTMRMRLLNGRLYFSVRNGNSTTWGTFGGIEDPLGVEYGCTLPNLNQYSPNVSVANSGVSFASNRVNSLKLKTVRYYNSSGTLIKTDSSSKTAFPME